LKLIAKDGEEESLKITSRPSKYSLLTIELLSGNSGEH